MPLNVIGSLKAPTLSWETDEETIRDEIEGTVSSLLGLIGIEADPLGSREHVLLSNLLEHNWRAGTDLDLGTPDRRRSRSRRCASSASSRSTPSCRRTTGTSSPCA